jgi:hypothetical protein
MNDIKCFVFPSKAKAKEDKYFEDDYKNIVKNGKFVIKEIENFRDEQITVKAVHVIKVRRNRSSC